MNVDPKSLDKEKRKIEEDLPKIKIETKKFNDPTFPKNDFDKFSIEDLD